LQAVSWTLVPNSGLNYVLIANNTIVNGNLFTGAGGTNSITNTNSQIRNNIITGAGSTVPSNSGIIFSNNNWGAIPSAAASSSNVVGNPQLARTGTTTPGTLTAAYFKILGNSPVINKTMLLSAVTRDFFLVSKGSTPDIGGREYTSSSTTPASSSLSLNRPVTVSSTQPAGTTSYNGSYAVDGNSATRWSSSFMTDPQWIRIDLGFSKQITRVVLNWETAYGRSYRIQVSDDNATWRDIYSTTTGNGGIDDLTGLSGTGRYVRMYGTARATSWGYSIYEMTVYGY
jgi:hypothetical protein